MRTLGQRVGIPKYDAWICQKCLETRIARATSLRSKAFRLSTLRNENAVANYSTSKPFSTRIDFFGDPVPKFTDKRRRRLIVLTGLIGLASIFALTDTARHSYAATLRSLRVAYALVKSVRESVFPIHLLLYDCLVADLRSTVIS